MTYNVGDKVLVQGINKNVPAWIISIGTDNSFHHCILLDNGTFAYINSFYYLKKIA